MGFRSTEKKQYIELEGTIKSPDCNPTSQQRAVWRFYESRNSDEADDIYSPEWYRRTLSFFEKFGRENNAPEVLESWEMIQNLEFGPFFLSHPIAAYALWHMLQAFYELDRTVCGIYEEEVKIIEKWKDLPPFEYLNAKNSKKIRVKWSKLLERMKKEIECGALEGEALISRLASILVAFQKVESAFNALKENFAENLSGMLFVDEMIKNVGKVVEERRRIIMDLLRPGDETQAHTSDTEASNDCKMGMSSQVSTEACSDGIEDSSSCSASPVEPRISFGDQTFPDWHSDEDSSQTTDGYGIFTSKPGVPSTDQSSDILISQLWDNFATAMKVSISCILIFLAFLCLINLCNLHEI
jgi:hypothetical protein